MKERGGGLGTEPAGEPGASRRGGGAWGAPGPRGAWGERGRSLEKGEGSLGEPGVKPGGSQWRRLALG